MTRMSEDEIRRSAEAALAETRRGSRAFTVFVLAAAFVLNGFAMLFVLGDQLRWLGWISLPLGLAGIVGVLVWAIPRRNSSSPRERGVAWSIIGFSALLLVAVPLWYWVMVIPRL
jgi:chromate transport protein ChrA